MPDSAAVKSMFSRIASRYDAANLLLSCGIDSLWRRRLVKRVKHTNPRDVLDLATGSGDVAFALSRNLKKTTRIVGMDFCQPMLDQAMAKQGLGQTRSYSNVTFQQGDGLALPLEDETFDALTISFGLRNLANRNRGLTEMRRVLRPGGTLFVLEFSQPHRWVRPLYYLYLRRILPRLAGLVTGDRAAYQYLNDTIAEFPNRETLAAEISSAGFTAVTAEPFTLGIVALHEAKR